MTGKNSVVQTHFRCSEDSEETIIIMADGKQT